MELMFVILKWTVFALVILGLLSATIRIVSQQRAMVVETLGRYTGTLTAARYAAAGRDVRTCAAVKAAGCGA